MIGRRRPHSRDGTRVVFASNRSGSKELWIANADRTGPRQVTTVATPGKTRCFGIALSPDERWLLFATVDRQGQDLMLVDKIQ